VFACSGEPAPPADGHLSSARGTDASQGSTQSESEPEPSSDAGASLDVGEQVPAPDAAPPPKRWQVEFTKLHVSSNGKKLSNGEDITVAFDDIVVLASASAPDPAPVDAGVSETFNAKDGSNHEMSTTSRLSPLATGNVVLVRAHLVGPNGKRCDLLNRHVFAQGGANGASFTESVYALPAWTGSMECSSGGGVFQQELRGDVTYELVQK